LQAEPLDSMPRATLSDSEYRQLADFRHRLRRYLHFSEAAAGKAGLTAQQYHALLALRAQRPEEATVGYVGRSLIIRQNSAAELVDRLVRQKLVRRRESAADRRRLELTVTARGTRILDRLARIHREELRRLASDRAVIPFLHELQGMAVLSALPHAGLQPARRPRA